METCVENVLTTPQLATIHVSCADAEEKNSDDSRQKPKAQSHGPAGRPETPETKTTAEKDQWSAWAWLGLCRKPSRKNPQFVHVRVDDFFASVQQVLNPKAAVAPVEHSEYAEVAERVGGILRMYTRAVEAGARDDFYLDFAGTSPGPAEFEAILRRMQAEILGRTGLRVAVGAARTRDLASMASGFEAGCGFHLVAAGEEEAFLAKLPVERLPGFKPEDAAHFAARGIKTFGQLRNVPKPVLQAAFGKTLGQQLWRLSRGLEARAAGVTAAPSLVSREKRIDGGTRDVEVLRGLLGYLHARVILTLREQAKQAQSIGVRIEHVDSFSVCETMRLTSATCDGPELLAAADKLLRKLFIRQVAVQNIRINVETVDAAPHQMEVVSAPAAAWRALRANAAAVGGLRWNAAS